MAGGSRSEDPNEKYPDDEVFYYRIAKEFGWTPTEVDEQPAYLMNMLMQIASIESEVTGGNN